MVDPVEGISRFPEEVIRYFACEVRLGSERLAAVTVKSLWSLSVAVVKLSKCLFSLFCRCVECKLVRIALEEILLSICIHTLISVETVEIKCGFVAVIGTD